MDRYYKHSGKILPQGIILGLLGGIVASVPLAFAYDYGIVSIPEAKLRIVCVFFYALLVGAATGMAMCWGKVRSKAVAGVVGLCTSLFALYLSWVVWIGHLALRRWGFDPTPGLVHPRAMWKAAVYVNSKGTWGLSHAPTSGFALWAVWGSEAAILLVLGVAFAVALVKRRPFCERCEQWCSKSQKLYFAPVIPPDQFKSRLEAGDLAFLGTMAPGDRKKAHYRLDLYTCTDCHALNTLSFEPNFRGGPITVMDKLILSGEQASAIRNLALSHSPQTRARAGTMSPSAK